jgi:hypothetical protein
MAAPLPAVASGMGAGSGLVTVGGGPAGLVVEPGLVAGGGLAGGVVAGGVVAGGVVAGGVVAGGAVAAL